MCHLTALKRHPAATTWRRQKICPIHRLWMSPRLRRRWLCGTRRRHWGAPPEEALTRREARLAQRTSRVHELARQQDLEVWARCLGEQDQRLDQLARDALARHKLAVTPARRDTTLEGCVV